MKLLMTSWLVLLFLSACSASKPTLFHTLGSVNAAIQPDLALSKRIPSLGVGPIKLPSLLDREGLVLRRSDFTLNISDKHQWGGQLKDEFMIALTQHLQRRLPKTHIRAIPWELEQTPLYQIVVNVSRFDAMPAKVASLQGDWRIEQAKDGKIVSTGLFDLERPVKGEAISLMVQAQSLLLSDLADQLIAQLASIP